MENVPMPHPVVNPSTHKLMDDIGSFSSLASGSFVPLRITSEGNAPFSGGLTAAEAGDVVFTEVVAKPHLVERTPDEIARGGSGYYKMSLLLSGTSVLGQDGREVTMRPGDLAVYDTSRPYSLLFGEEIRNLIVMFPKRRLDLPAPITEQLTAVPLNEQHAGLPPVVASFLAQFPARLTPLSQQLRAKIAHTSLDLISMLFSNILDATEIARDPHQVLLQRIYAYIDENLGTPDLSPGMIAQAHFISTRHLHSLFRQVDTTVSLLIRERRLERCREDLLDPTCSSHPVSAIAARWGFSDAAHFSRTFKSTYGVPPSELRHTQQA